MVSSSAEGVGDARSEMGVDYVGDKVRMSFNPDFLLDFAKVNLPDQIPMSFKDESAAVRRRSEEPAREERLSIYKQFHEQLKAWRQGME